MQIQVYNRITRTIVTIDTKESRFKRKRRRINVWAKEYKELINHGRDRSKPYDGIFVTLTYKDNDQVKPGDIRTYLHRLKKRLGPKLIGYAWVLEMQKRGVPHYHIMIVVKKGTRIEKPDRKDWTGGSSNISRCKKGVYYIISYCKKALDLDANYPKGFRIFAVYSKDNDTKYFIRRKSLPFWLMDQLQDLYLLSKTIIKKIGSSWLVGGITYPSPFVALNGKNKYCPLTNL